MVNNLPAKRHKVLVFGEKVYGSTKPKLIVDYCDVDILSFPGDYSRLSSLADYDLVVLDYSMFSSASVDLKTIRTYENRQEVIFKLMIEALGKGTAFCILHYDERVPRHSDYSHDLGYMDKDDVRLLEKEQIGFRWLTHLGVRPYADGVTIPPMETKRNEFASFHERWGTSKNYFLRYGDRVIDDDLIGVERAYQGFVFHIKKGKLIFLPCQRDFDRPEAIKDCLQVLISSLITYLTRASTEIPEWLNEPIFDQEIALYDDLSKLESQIQAVRTEIEPYQAAKKLVALGEYDLENEILHFFETHLGLTVSRDEKFKEDFWIVDSSLDHMVICEIKSGVRGLRRSDIYALYNHREENKLDEAFPALLIGNYHRNANSWKDKSRKISTQDYQIAVQNNVLIVRVEDLLFFWNLILEGKYTSADLLKYIIEESGWMEVSKDGKIAIHR